jgi:integrase
VIVDTPFRFHNRFHNSGRTMNGSDQPEPAKPERAKPKKWTFSDLGLKRLRPPVSGQVVHWDDGIDGQRGLSILVSAGGTKTYRATYRLHGKFKSVSIGRVGEMSLGAARKRTQEYRENAANGIDPIAGKKNSKEPVTTGAGVLYDTVVDKFIEQYAKPRQRTWYQTERSLKGSCRPFLGRPIASISKQEALALLDGFIADHHPYKAAVTRVWLRTLWRWACTRGYVPEPPIMDRLEIEFERRVRELVYDEAAIRASWQAADQLDWVEGAYIKLLMLLAPRKRELAWMTWAHLDNPDKPTLWTTPFELTKSRKRQSNNKKRQYLTPLPKLAQQILQGLPKGAPDDRVFSTLSVRTDPAGGKRFNGDYLIAKLIRRGAPANFKAHAWRHTIATWLEKEGASDFERGLVLNHSGQGVTAGYSHGFAHKLKLDLLTKWAEHVEKLVQPTGVALLR